MSIKNIHYLCSGIEPHTMKKYLITIITATASLFATTPHAQAYDCEVDGIYYSRISATELEVANKVFSDQNRTAYTGAITIPAQVTYNGKTFNVVSIGDYAFRDCSSLTSVTIPNSVTEIKSYAFYGCSAIANITIPASVTEIGMGAFEGCSALAQMALPPGIPVIEDETFYGCSSLRSIVIPSSVTAIGEEAFSRCASLISIYCFPSSAPECEMNAFSKVDRTWCTLYVPKDSKVYSESAIWREFFIEEYTGKAEDINFSSITK